MKLDQSGLVLILQNSEGSVKPCSIFFHSGKHRLHHTQMHLGVCFCEAAAGSANLRLIGFAHLGGPRHWLSELVN